MAVSGGFGLPPPRRPSPTDEAAVTQSGVRFVRLLSVLTTHGRWQPLAVAPEEDKLQQYLEAWLRQPGNRQQFAGQSRFDFLPAL